MTADPQNPERTLQPQSGSERQHPFVVVAELRLTMAKQAAADVPFPYAEGTPVILVTPTGQKFEGRVVSCDPEKFLQVDAFGAPYWWGERTLWFWSETAPESIHDGMIELRTDFRTSPEPVVIPEPPRPI